MSIVDCAIYEGGERIAGRGLLAGAAHEGHYEPIPEEVRDYFRDVYDHVVRANETVDGLREMLNGILDANVAQISVRQHDDMRKISAWVAIATIPTSMAAIWGMNFDHMPELHWLIGYPLALGLMLLICVVLYRAFKRAGWL